MSFAIALKQEEEILSPPVSARAAIEAVSGGNSAKQVFDLTALSLNRTIWRGDQLGQAALPGLPTGWPALDAQLPGGGWPLGALTELLPVRAGIGEIRCLLPAWRAVQALGEPVFWVQHDASGKLAQRAMFAGPRSVSGLSGLLPLLPLQALQPYTPALQAAGLDLKRLVFIHTRTEADALWAAEQILKSGAGGALVAWLNHPHEKSLRRLQVAAEGQRIVAMLIRPAVAERSSSPAPLRLSLGPQAGQLAVRIVKRRGPPLQRPVLLDLPLLSPSMALRLKSRNVALSAVSDASEVTHVKSLTPASPPALERALSAELGA